MTAPWYPDHYSCSEYLGGNRGTDQQKSEYMYASYFVLGYFESRFAERPNDQYDARARKFLADLQRVCSADTARKLLDALKSALPTN